MSREFDDRVGLTKEAVAFTAEMLDTPKTVSDKKGR
jgi:hypothetical protein